MARSPRSLSPSLDARQPPETGAGSTAAAAAATASTKHALPRAAASVRLERTARSGTTKFTCFAGAEHLFTVQLADVAAGLTIAEEGLRRCRAGDSYNSVRDWLKFAKLDAGGRQHAAERISLHRWQWRGKPRFSCRVGSQELFFCRFG